MIPGPCAAGCPRKASAPVYGGAAPDTCVCTVLGGECTDIVHAPALEEEQAMGGGSGGIRDGARRLGNAAVVDWVAAGGDRVQVAGDRRGAAAEGRQSSSAVASDIRRLSLPLSTGEAVEGQAPAAAATSDRVLIPTPAAQTIPGEPVSRIYRARRVIYQAQTWIEQLAPRGRARWGGTCAAAGGHRLSTNG